MISKDEIKKSLHDTQPFFIFALCIAMLFLQFQINTLTTHINELQNKPAASESAFCKVVVNDTISVQVNNSKLQTCG